MIELVGKLKLTLIVFKKITVMPNTVLKEQKRTKIIAWKAERGWWL